MALVRTGFLGGEHLPSLLEEADFHLEAMHKFHNNISVPNTSAYRETISILIDKGEHTSKKSYDVDMSNTTYGHRYNETLWLNKMLQAFWLGHATRCHHFATKALEKKPDIGNHNRLVALFYATLNSFRGIKSNNGSGSQFAKMKPLYEEATDFLQSASEISPGSCNNKIYLLQAEMFSFEKKNQQAKEKYTASISLSRYVHEKGLACEQAGSHHQKIGNASEALKYFEQAKQCYKEWGSQMKMEAMDKAMSRLSGSAKV